MKSSMRVFIDAIASTMDDPEDRGDESLEDPSEFNDEVFSPRRSQRELGRALSGSAHVITNIMLF